MQTVQNGMSILVARAGASRAELEKVTHVAMRGFDVRRLPGTFHSPSTTRPTMGRPSSPGSNTAKGQPPGDVRAALHVSPGDLIAWEVGADGTATVRRVQPLDVACLRAVEGNIVRVGE